MDFYPSAGKTELWQQRKWEQPRFHTEADGSAPQVPLAREKFSHLSESQLLHLEKRRKDYLLGSPKIRIHTDLLKEPAIKQIFKE